MSEYTIHILSFIVGLAIISLSFYLVLTIKEKLYNKKNKKIPKNNVYLQEIVDLSSDALEKIRLQQEMDKQEMSTLSEKLRDVIYNKRNTYLFQNVLFCTLVISDIIDKCNIDNIYAKRIKKNFDSATTVHDVEQNLMSLGLNAKFHKNHMIDIEKI